MLQERIDEYRLEFLARRLVKIAVDEHDVGDVESTHRRQAEVCGADDECFDAGVGIDRTDGQSMPRGHWRDPTERRSGPGGVCTKCEASTIGSMPTRLVLIRHGESNVTVRRVIGGHRTCDGLSPLGVLQTERLAARWAESDELVADVLISSHFPRARQTAEILRPALGLGAVEVDPAFGEHDPGPDIDGLSFDDYVERFGTPDWNGDPHTEIFPGGETTAEFHLRVGAAVTRLVRAREDSSIVIVCHGGVIDAVFRRTDQEPVDRWFRPPDAQHLDHRVPRSASRIDVRELEAHALQRRGTSRGVTGLDTAAW